MNNFENLATKAYTKCIDENVKEELQIADIPVFRLPGIMDAEVKTHYIGILNGFVFYRAWTYWVCTGDMPLDTANIIYAKYKDMNIRAGGHANNLPPETQSYNPVYSKALSDLLKTVGYNCYMKEAENIVDDESLPRFVGTYHIDTQLGLVKLAKTIRDLDIHTEMKMES